MKKKGGTEKEFRYYICSIGADVEEKYDMIRLSMGRISGWMALHEDELYAAWNNAVREKPFSKIEPLK